MGVMIESFLEEGRPDIVNNDYDISASNRHDGRRGEGERGREREGGEREGGTRVQIES
jgi:hypothetical protein